MAIKYIALLPALQVTQTEFSLSLRKVQHKKG